MGTGILDGRTAYVTGGSSGIGAASALALARLGASVVLGARRKDRLLAVQQRIESEVKGARVLGLELDVTNDLSLDEWIDEAGALGPCSILVNNAGLALGRPRVDELDLADMDTMLDVNVRGAFAVTRKLLPGMIARGASDVVILGSVAGSEPYANGSIYCASKAALHAFSRSLRAELLGKDVRVLLFEPGMVETEFSVVRNKGDVDAAKKVYAGMRPVTAEDVAECIAFAVTRPRHVCLDRMMVMATDQCGPTQIFRR